MSYDELLRTLTERKFDYLVFDEYFDSLQGIKIVVDRKQFNEYVDTLISQLQAIEVDMRGLYGYYYVVSTDILKASMKVNLHTVRGGEIASTKTLVFIRKRG